LKVRESDIPKDPKCKYIITATTGIDHIDVVETEKTGMQVISLQGHTDFLKTITATAEHTLGLIFALIRHIPFAFDSVRDGKWNRDNFRGHELQGKTVGIVGYGRLGRIVADYLKVLGMRIIIYDPYVSSDDPDIEQKADLEELLLEADIVSVHITLNSETECLFDETRFTQMKPATFFINTSRGAIVDELALLSALKAGHIAGAALDVICGEPRINSQHSIVDYAVSHDNLIITPHIGGCTWESMKKCEEYLARVVAKDVRDRWK
jgi:D-3-phosphoglycerate dehydrogenase